MNDTTILTYHPSHRQKFIDLNMEWLEKYFIVEPHDINVFENIESLILANDGEIFFCEFDQVIVGTVAMQKIAPGIYELAKMAVTEKYKGKGFGNLLIEACIRFAKSKDAKKIILLSNRTLTPAISLYTKYGFREVPIEATDYSRANIQMVLNLI